MVARLRFGTPTGYWSNICFARDCVRLRRLVNYSPDVENALNGGILRKNCEQQHRPDSSVRQKSQSQDYDTFGTGKQASFAF